MCILIKCTFESYEVAKHGHWGQPGTAYGLNIPLRVLTLASYPPELFTEFQCEELFTESIPETNIQEIMLDTHWSTDQSHTDQSHTDRSHTDRSHTDQSHNDQSHRHTLTNHILTNHAPTSHTPISHTSSSHTTTDHTPTSHALTNHTIMDHTLNNHTLTSHMLTNHTLTNHPLINHRLTGFLTDQAIQLTTDQTVDQWPWPNNLPVDRLTGQTRSYSWLNYHRNEWSREWGEWMSKKKVWTRAIWNDLPLELCSLPVIKGM